MKLKLGGTPTVRMVYYFVVQELGGLMFLSGLRDDLMVVSLLVKGGLSPFHFWMSKLMTSSWGVFSWFLTIQKLGYYWVLPIFLGWKWTLVLVVGRLLPLVQGVFVQDRRAVVFYLTTSGGSYMVVLGTLDHSLMMVLCPVYLFSLYLLLSSGHVRHEVVLMLGGFPGGAPFYLKLVSVCSLSVDGFILMPFVLGRSVLGTYLGVGLLRAVETPYTYHNKL